MSTKKNIEDRPVRPEGLRSELLKLYFMVFAVLAIFAGITYTITHEVPEGHFEKLDGTLIKLEDFDPVQLGPYPKCHSHYGEHQSANGTWVKNKEVEKEETDDDFEYPVAHPENSAWLEKKLARANESKMSFRSIQPSLHLLLISVLVVFLGCRHSVWLYVKPDVERDGEDDTELDESIGQSAIKDQEAYLFPIFGSCVLFGLFVIYKYLDSDRIKFLFSCYVIIMCANGFGINMGQFIALCFNSRSLGRFKTLFTIPYFRVKVTYIDIIAYIIAAGLGYQYILTKNWIINNIMGVSFCLLGLKHIGISSYKTGVIMLCGLFVYDIFWVFGSKSVFGSNVMVTVAVGVEAPIKLMFPRSQDGCGKLMFSMLGLGDIVVPGIFLGLLAKWDVSRPDAKTSPSGVYLNWTMVTYALSLVTTVLIMLIFNAAQPALLYIVPYTIVGSLAVALSKKQFSDLLAFEVQDTMEEDAEELIVEEKKEK